MILRRNFISLAKKFHASQDGGVAMIFALSFIAIITVVGLGFDYSRALSLQAALNVATDAAALAAARDPDVDADNLQARAEAFFTANTQDLPFGNNFVLIAQALPLGGGVKVDVTAQIDTTLMAIAGVKKFDVSASSEAVYSTSKIELALVLDNTGSMGNYGKIQTLRAASHDMVDLLMPDGGASENVKIGVVPFDIGVNVGVGFAMADWMDAPDGTWEGCVGPRAPNHDVSDSNPITTKIPPIYGDQTSCNIPSILPLSVDASALHAKIEDMQAVGWTYIPEGLAWGWRVLSSKLPFQEGVPPDDEDWQKVLVLMTDGANTVQWSWPGGVPEAQTSASSWSGNSKTATLCDAIKAKDILIYTVAFQVNSSTTRQMLEDCATDPGNYFDAQNNAALESAFAKIGGDINNLRLSK